MSLARNGINGGHFYSNIISPIKIDMNFVVDSANGNGLGLRSLKSNGFVRNVFMNSANPPAGTPAMGTARSYGILGASAISNTGSSVVTGNLGLSPGSAVTGFPPGTFSGVENVDNAAAVAAQSSALASYNSLAAHGGYSTIPSALDGQTLTAGYYQFASGAATLALSAPGTLTLNGSATDIFVIKTTTTYGSGAGGAAVVALTGGAKASNVYFIVGSSATINQTGASVHRGNILANTSITSGGGDVQGSLIALNGAVTLSAATTIEVQPLAGTPAAGNPNPAPGYALIQFKSNYNKYLGGFSGQVSPLSGVNIAVNSTNLVLGNAYVIVSVGSSTLADWNAVGLPAGLTPAVGQSFIAIKSGNGAGSGLVQAPGFSGVNSIEVIGDPNTEINNSSIAANGGAWLLVQFLYNGVLTPPLDGSVVGLSAFFDQSSVTVDGL